jgi:hypothetical protein
MIESIAEPPLVPKGAVIESRGNGITLRLPLCEFRANWGKLLVGLICSGLITSGLPMLWREPDLPPVLVIYLCLYAMVFLLLLAIAMDTFFRRAIFSATADQLRLEVRGLMVLLWRRTWERKKLRWIVATPAGLQVVGTEGREIFFAREEHNKLAWLAGVLRDTLQLEREHVAAAGEIEVTFVPDERVIPQRGFLYASPGRLGVRYPFLTDYEREFFAAPVLDPRAVWHVQIGKRYPLSPEDARCTMETDGVACLQILRTSWPKVMLTVWCDDKEALAGALGRFWGAKE